MRNSHGLRRCVAGDAAGLPRGGRARHPDLRSGRAGLHPVRGLPAGRVAGAGGRGTPAGTAPRRGPADHRRARHAASRRYRARPDRHRRPGARRPARRRGHGPPGLVHQRGRQPAAPRPRGAAPRPSRHHRHHPGRQHPRAGPRAAGRTRGHGPARLGAAVPPTRRGDAPAGPSGARRTQPVPGGPRHPPARPSERSRRRRPARSALDRQPLRRGRDTDGGLARAGRAARDHPHRPGLADQTAPRRGRMRTDHRARLVRGHRAARRAGPDRARRVTRTTAHHLGPAPASAHRASRPPRGRPARRSHRRAGAGVGTTSSLRHTFMLIVGNIMSNAVLVGLGAGPIRIDSLTSDCGGLMTETTETEIMSASGCPVSHTDYTIQRPLLETYELLTAERERGPFLWNDSRPRPFWMITDYEHVLEALQMPDVFSNEVINALAPEHTFDLLPQYLDPPEHTAMRRVLNRWFAPAAVRRLEPLVLRRCTELIEELRPEGGCDLVSDFAIRFPTDLFLATLNLPISDGDVFLEHVENEIGRA